MKRLSAVVAALLLSALAQSANAGLLNSDVKGEYLFPTIDTEYQDLGRGVVDADGVQMRFDSYFTMNVTDRQIAIDFASAALWSPAPYNGFSLTNFTTAMPQFTVGAATNMVGFGASNVSVVDNVLYVNWQGLAFNANTLVVLEVDEPSDVPEPLSLSLLGLGLAGLAASRRLGK